MQRTGVTNFMQAQNGRRRRRPIDEGSQKNSTRTDTFKRLRYIYTIINFFGVYPIWTELYTVYPLNANGQRSSRNRRDLWIDAFRRRDATDELYHIAPDSYYLSYLSSYKPKGIPTSLAFSFYRNLATRIKPINSLKTVFFIP